MKALTTIRTILLACLISLSMSCTKSKECIITPSNIPECVLEKTKEEKYSPIKTIKAVCIDGDIHYWLNTDDAHVDGTEAIVNSQCDTVCSIGGWRPPLECGQSYSYDDWILVWER